MRGIARGGFFWILASFLLTLVFLCLMFLLQGNVVVVTGFFCCLFFIVSLLLLIFFRDPERIIGNGVVAVADGEIREITSVHDEEIGGCILISTFMNIHNVHVNRMPLDGQISTLQHYPGAHIPAFQKESERNERVVLMVDTSIGTIKIIQIAGTVARRIVPYVIQGDMLRKGDKIGIIRLGSRVDVLLPTKKIKQVTVTAHDKVKAGEATIAELYD